MAGEHARAGVPEGLDGKGLRIGLVRSRWNAPIGDRLEEGVRRGLSGLGVAPDDLVVASVPGAFEIPLACRALAASGRVDAVVCIGVVIRGETTHYDIVAGECARGVQEVQLGTSVPVAFGVLTVEDEDQALARSAGPGGHNVGEEAAAVAVEMARLLEAWRPA